MTILDSCCNAEHCRILLINGPNLNLLGVREPEIYGSASLQDIEQRLVATAKEHKIELVCIQSNNEGELVEAIQYHGLLAEKDNYPEDMIDAVIINPAAFTHTSVAIRDALLAINKPFIEVHLSNIHNREAFRSHSYFSDKAIGVICGLGDMGYDFALTYLIDQMQY